jgi:hypothetical protein
MATVVVEDPGERSMATVVVEDSGERSMATVVVEDSGVRRGHQIRRGGGLREFLPTPVMHRQPAAVANWGQRLFLKLFGSDIFS